MTCCTRSSAKTPAWTRPRMPRESKPPRAGCWRTKLRSASWATWRRNETLDFGFWILDSSTESDGARSPIINPKSKIQNPRSLEASMHVLMLGWEFPPFIAGGLGTACHGLTKALDRHGVSVTFVLPKAIDRSQSSHVNLVSPAAPEPASGMPGKTSVTISSPAGPVQTVAIPETTESEAADQSSGPSIQRIPFENVRFIGVPAGFNNPYQRTAGNQP